MRNYATMPGYPKLPPLDELLPWLEEYDARRQVRLEELDPPQQKRVEYYDDGYGHITEIVEYVKEK